MRRFEFWAQRDGANYRQLLLADGSSPTVSWTADAKIKRTVTLECVPDDAVNWLNDRLSVQLVGDDLPDPIPCGLFFVTTAPLQEDDSGQTVQSLTGYDMGYALSELGRLERVLTVPAGSRYTDVVRAQLVTAGVSRLQITESDEVLPVAVEFETGETRYDVVAAMLQAINYRELWFDGQGTAIVEPWKPAQISPRTHVYDADRGILRGGMSRNDDTFNAANVFISIVDSPDLDQPLCAEAVNDFESSPLSVQRRGRRIPDIEFVDGIASQDALQTRAENRKLLSMMSSTVYEFSTDAIREREHGLNDAVVLQRWDAGLLEEQDWSLQCSSDGLMTHTAREVFYNVGDA